MADIQYLTQQEIDDFVKQLDKDNDGCISYSEVEQKLDQVYKELQPEPKAHNLHHESRKNTQRHEFLRSVLGTEKDKIPVENFKTIVEGWQIPSVQQEKQTEKEERDYLNGISWLRKLRALWEVEGPEYCFLAFVVRHKSHSESGSVGNMRLDHNIRLPSAGAWHLQSSVPVHSIRRSSSCY